MMQERLTEARGPRLGRVRAKEGVLIALRRLTSRVQNLPVQSAGLFHRRYAKSLPEDLDAALVLPQGGGSVAGEPVKSDHFPVDFLPSVVQGQDSSAVSQGAFVVSISGIEDHHLGQGVQMDETPLLEDPLEQVTCIPSKGLFNGSGLLRRQSVARYRVQCSKGLLERQDVAPVLVRRTERDSLFIDGQITFQICTDLGEGMAQTPEGIAQVLARGLGRIVSPEQSGQTLAMVASAVVQDQETEQQMGLLRRKSYKRSIRVSSPTRAKETHSKHHSPLSFARKCLPAVCSGPGSKDWRQRQ